MATVVGAGVCGKMGAQFAVHKRPHRDDVSEADIHVTLDERFEFSVKTSSLDRNGFNHLQGMTNVQFLASTVFPAKFGS